MHFGIISPPVPGHLYPNGMIALELIKRGHQVTVYNILDTKNLVVKLGIEFYPVAEMLFPVGSWVKHWEAARSGSNLFRDLNVLKLHVRIARQMLIELPLVLKQQMVDILLVDQLQPQGAALADILQIPYITICSILPIHVNFNGKIPPAFAWWQPSKNPLIKLANKTGHLLTGLISIPYLKMIHPFLKNANLLAYKSINQTFSKRLQIGIIPEDFDFPGNYINPIYFSFGPFVQEREKVEFPWSKLDNRPLIYVSMGTIRNSIQKIYNALLPALAQFTDYQVVLSKGAWSGAGVVLKNISDNILVVDYAPQLELLERASLCITHAGPGTVLESVYYGVPMVCIPVSDDQPAMAARVKFHGIGEVVPWRKISEKKLLKAISNVLKTTSFKTKCTILSNKIKPKCGADKAADLIQQIFVK